MIYTNFPTSWKSANIISSNSIISTEYFLLNLLKEKARKPIPGLLRRCAECALEIQNHNDTTTVTKKINVSGFWTSKFFFPTLHTFKRNRTQTIHSTRHAHPRSVLLVVFGRVLNKYTLFLKKKKKRGAVGSKHIPNSTKCFDMKKM